METERRGAASPDEIMHLFVDRANAGDADGLAALYEPEAILAYPPGRTTRGREAIRAVYGQMVARGLTFGLEEALPAIELDGIALTSSYRADGVGLRVQVARLQPDGSWLRIIDRPEPPPPAGRGDT